MRFLFLSALAEEAVETAGEAVEAVEEAAESAPSWFQTAFGDFADISIWGWILLAVLLVGGIVVYRMVKGEKKTVWTTRMLSLGAISMALSSVLSMIKILEMPQGGSVTAVSMLPIILFAYAYGVGPGLTLGVIHGILQCILDPYVISIPQFLLDYPIAFGVIGLAGLFSKSANDRVGLTVGTVVACVGRFISSVASGVIFFAEWAPEGMSPMVYSMSYNGSYMIPECIITVVVALLVGPRLIKELRKVK